MTTRILKYGFIFLIVYIVCLYLTFPWSSVKDRVLQQASQQTGKTITAESLQPSWLTGFVARNVSISIGPDKPPLSFEWISARVRLIDLIFGGTGGTIHVPLGRGETHLRVSAKSQQITATADISDVELALVPAIQAGTGMLLSGMTNLDADVELDLKEVKQSVGVINLSIGELELLKGSKVAQLPLPFGLALGNIDWTVPIEDGKALFRHQQIQGPDVEAGIDGDITLSQQLERSRLNLIVKFRPTSALLQREKTLSLLLNNIERYKGRDGFYSYRITGTIKHPRSVPERR
ncbi:MAG: type II secretion system protein GspN [Myxococcales bacterium]|nr:type II secretion system protein GspN [Myxococcales bacterium]